MIEMYTFIYWDTKRSKYVPCFEDRAARRVSAWETREEAAQAMAHHTELGRRMVVAVSTLYRITWNNMSELARKATAAHAA